MARSPVIWQVAPNAATASRRRRNSMRWLTTNETLMLVVAGVTGLVLGAIFFGGLWWTVRTGVSSPRPAVRLLGSTLLRMGITLAGSYFVGRGHWDRMLVELGMQVEI